MDEIRTFFDMGGYAVFVWPCYALTLLIMLGFLATTLRDLRARERRLRQLEARRPARRRPRGGGAEAAP